MITAQDILDAMEPMRDAQQASQLMRFFKTGEGEYGEGDRFLGLWVPQVRLIVKQARLDVPFQEIDKLLASPWHEARLAALLLLVEEMKAALPARRGSEEKRLQKSLRREGIVRFYLDRAERVNNWDLVDLTCPKILGEWLLHPKADGSMPDRDVLYRLVGSRNLWEQRIGIVSTWRLIRAGETEDALRLAEILLPHPHDLIHKATGWMLREVGKKDMDALEAFLEKHCTAMSRTTLRYAIEKMADPRRRSWLAR